MRASTPHTASSSMTISISASAPGPHSERGRRWRTSGRALRPPCPRPRRLPDPDRRRPPQDGLPATRGYVITPFPSTQARSRRRRLPDGREARCAPIGFARRRRPVRRRPERPRPRRRSCRPTPEALQASGRRAELPTSAFSSSWRRPNPHPLSESHRHHDRGSYRQKPPAVELVPRADYPRLGCSLFSLEPEAKGCVIVGM